MPPAWSSADRLISSAAFLASLLSSCTVKMTGVSGAASLNWWARARAFSSSGRTLTRVLICSLKTLWHSARWRASSWLASSWRAVDVLAYPILIGRSVRGAGTIASAGPCFHARPGCRSAGTGISSSSRSAGTRTKRGVWYFAAVFPPRVRQALPAGASHFVQSWRSTASAA